MCPPPGAADCSHKIDSFIAFLTDVMGVQFPYAFGVKYNAEVLEVVDVENRFAIKSDLESR